MTRILSNYLLMKNGQPFAIWNDKVSAMEGVNALEKGWHIYKLYKMPNANHPLFAQRELNFAEFKKGNEIVA